jgi:HlyD family secretion protein
LDSSSALSGSSSSSTSQAATQFQVRIRIMDKEEFRPGMSVSAEIETRARTNVLAVPIASVTTRVIKANSSMATGGMGTNSVLTNSIASADTDTNSFKTGKKPDEKNKPVDVVFVVEGDHVKTVPVKIGISDDDFWEITDGLKEGDEVVTGNYNAISRSLDDGKKISKSSGTDSEKSKS